LEEKKPVQFTLTVAFALHPKSHRFQLGGCNVRLTQLYKSIAADNASYHRLTTKRFSRIFKPVSISEACVKFHTAARNLLYFSSSSHLTLVLSSQEDVSYHVMPHPRFLCFVTA
jgi:hypothetical protein